MTPNRLAALIAGALSVPAYATDYTDTAQVVSVSPIYERVADSRQECYVETASTPQGQPAQERSVVAPIIGGVAGAILGGQVGQGRGRDAASAVGAVVGAVAADRVANPNSQGSIAGAAVGGAAGAILGNQVGQGHGRTAATAAGAVTGAVVGDRVMGRGGQPGAQAQGTQRCRMVDAGTREIVKGYTVVYRYNGRDVTTQLPYDPGSTVRVAVGVIDNTSPRPAPKQSSGFGSNVRTIPASQAEPPGSQAPSAGGYQYRY